jgi:hypothetical protein
MATKPTDPVDWAESGTATNPASKRANGWLDNDLLPAENANYLWRALGRWVTFFGALFSNSGALTQDVAGGSLVASTDGSTRDLDHVPDGDATFVSADNLRSRGLVYIGQPTLASAEGAISEQISALAGARSVQMRGAGAQATGLNIGAIRVTESTPSTADMATLHPLTSTLYGGNLAKIAGQILISDVGATGAYNTIAISGGYNLASVSVTAGTPDVIVITPTTAFTATTVICSVGPQPGGTLPVPVIFGGVSHTAVTAIAFVGGAWVDLFGAGVATALGANLRLNIVAY